MVCLGIFLIAAVIAVGAYINNEFVATGDEKASTGDKVSVNYTGTYYDEYGNEKAVVFDTSWSSVASDDDIAKSNDFTKKSSYSPLSFTIGNKTMLEEFENSVVGHKVGDVYDIVIDAAHGYVGTITEDKLQTTGNKMNTYELMSIDSFKTAYSDVTLKDNAVVEFETKFKWTGYAMLTDNGKNVYITYLPEAGESYQVYESGSTKVTYKVTSVDDYTITYDIDIQQPVFVSEDGDIQMIKLDLGDDTIYITNISGDDITYKAGTNAERVNQTLYFHIEVVSIN